METIKFTVAMNNEEKLAKNTHDVEIHVERPAGIPDIVWTHAIANYKVKLQGQIRPNWDTFIKDSFPKTLEFGQALYAKAKAPAVITTESAQTWMNTGSPLEQLKKKISIVEGMGMEVPAHMLEELTKLEIASA